MRAILQRVRSSSVSVDGREVARIGTGLNVLLGVGRGDDEAAAGKLADTTTTLRIFPDERGRMHRSVLDEGGELLVVPQFTLYGDCSRGRRPDFTGAADRETASTLCDAYVAAARDAGLRVEEGIFGADMMVEISNWGPVTIILET